MHSSLDLPSRQRRPSNGQSCSRSSGWSCWNCTISPGRKSRNSSCYATCWPTTTTRRVRAAKRCCVPR